MSVSRYSQTTEEDALVYVAMPHLEKMQQFIADTLYALSQHTAMSVLELGCGTGITADHILSMHPNVTLQSVDNEAASIDEARKRLAPYLQEGKVSLAVADMNDYLKQQPNDSFDIIVSALAIHNCYAEYRQETYREVLRVLKKGGLFINADKFAADDESEHAQALAWQLERFGYFVQASRPDLKEKWTKHYQEDEAPNRILKESAFVKDLTDVGFQNIRKAIREQMEAIYIAEKK